MRRPSEKGDNELMFDDKSPQQRVSEFVDEFSLDLTVQSRLLDLNSEAGELAKEFLKATSYGQKEFQSTPEWHSEIGDVYFALLCVAEKSGVDLESALDDAMQRYADRVHEHGVAGNPEYTPE
jgi:NTP pyrophosphatase (non-canonical NTP hydrolase)